MSEYEIKPREKFRLGFREMWHYRELFYFFTWRDIKVKYKQTLLGFLWAILQPLFITLVFTVFVGDTISSGTKLEVPYPVFALSGMILWGVFSGGMSNAANSMVSNANIIKKIYFPRLIIPVSSIFVALVDFVMAFLVFVPVMIYYKLEINYLALLYLPLSVLITCMAAIGCGTFLAALNIKYRDVRYVIPFFVQGLLFLTPVLYPVNVSGNIYAQMILKYNPLSGALELIRAFYSNGQINFETVGYSFVSSLLLMIIGLAYFKRTENYFADLV